jgi:hypothetical protein
MAVISRTAAQLSEFIQDSFPISDNLNGAGDIMEVDINTQSLLKIYRNIYGLSKMIGEASRRHGAKYFTGDDVTLTGTITSSGVTVTGSGTAFTSELSIGDFISATANEYREVTNISSDTSLTLQVAFNSDIGSAEAFKRRQFLAERLDSFESGSLGMISGGLSFNTTSLPPTVLAGVYNVSYKNIQVDSDTTLALSDSLLNGREALDAYNQYLIVVNPDGEAYYTLYGEGAVSGATGTITSITGSGTTKTLTVASGTVGNHNNKILVITGNNGVNGVFKITGGNFTSTYEFESVATITGGASGTWAVYERIKTNHGSTGTAAAVTTDSEVIKYNPMYGDNGWSAGIAAYNASKNGYYLTISGLTNYRVIGSFKTKAAGSIMDTVISFKSGKERDWKEVLEVDSIPLGQPFPQWFDSEQTIISKYPYRFVRLTKDLTDATEYNENKLGSQTNATTNETKFYTATITEYYSPLKTSTIELINSTENTTGVESPQPTFLGAGETAQSRLVNQFQGHKINIRTGTTGTETSFSPIYTSDNGQTGIASQSGTLIIADNQYGTPRVGKTTRPDTVTAIFYMRIK